MASNGVDIAKAYVQIVPSAQGIQGSISQAIGGEADSAGQSAGSRIASAIKTAIITAGIGEALKTALTEGAALEQSIGGIETLYKDAADEMIAYADEAYKTAGLSANAYMEQATSFAASLIQSLEGDTQAAAQAANTAIIDMADNANKMGTSIESIQNAYQGFAKQNYTMLDNLKLGYGGTKEEMERLLADAQKISGVEYDISNLADVYSAIHVIQEELGITGTTASEAADTLAGSFSSMKAAASNLLANLTLGRDIQGPLQALVETTTTFLTDNLMPALVNILSNLPTIIGQIISALPGLIGQIVTQGIPQLLTSATTMINTLRDGFISNLPTLISQAMPMMLALSEQILANANMLIEAGIMLIIELVNGLVAGLPALIEYVPQIITNICNIINENMPKILAAAITIIITLAQGLIEALPTVVANMGSIIEAIFSCIAAVNWLSLGTTILTGLANGIKSLATAPVTLIKNIGNNIVNAFKGGISWSSLGTAIMDGIKSGINAGKEAILKLMKNIASSCLDKVKSFLGIHSPSHVFRDQVGKMIPLGFAEGLEENAKYVASAMDDIAALTLEPFDANVTADVNRTATVSAKDFNTAQQTQDAQLAAMMEAMMAYMGDITIPVYIGNDRLDTMIVKATDRMNYRSGGR